MQFPGPEARFGINIIILPCVSPGVYKKSAILLILPIIELFNFSAKNLKKIAIFLTYSSTSALEWCVECVEWKVKKLWHI